MDQMKDLDANLGNIFSYIFKGVSSYYENFFALIDARRYYSGGES